MKIRWMFIGIALLMLSGILLAHFVADKIPRPDTVWVVIGLVLTLGLGGGLSGAWMASSTPKKTLGTRKINRLMVKRAGLKARLKTAQDIRVRLVEIPGSLLNHILEYEQKIAEIKEKLRQAGVDIPE
jgi:hypothetical protein